MKMEGPTLDNLKQTKNTATEFTNGPMAKSTLEIGIWGNKMVKQFILAQKDRLGRVYGEMENELNG